MSTRVLVTGASGFAGSHLVEALDTPGTTVVAWAHRGGHRPPAGVQATWDAVDLLDSDAVHRALADARPDLVYHCAGAAQAGGAWDRIGQTFETNVRGTARLLSAIHSIVPTARVVVTSSALVYAPSTGLLRESSPLAPAGPYAVSKLAQEMLCLRAAADALDLVVARPFNHIGPRQSAAFVASSVARQLALIEAGQAEPQLLVGNLEARRDLTDVRDTVRAYIQIAEHGDRHGIYNVCSGRAVVIRDLVQNLASRARVPVVLVSDPARYRPIDVPVVMGSAERLAARTGWEPRVPMGETLDDLLNWWRNMVAAG